MTTWPAIAALVNDADVEGCLRGRFIEMRLARPQPRRCSPSSPSSATIHPRQWHDPRPTGAHPPYSPDAVPDPLDRLVVLRPVSGDRRRAAVLPTPSAKRPRHRPRDLAFLLPVAARRTSRLYSASPARIQRAEMPMSPAQPTNGRVIAPEASRPASRPPREAHHPCAHTTRFTVGVVMTNEPQPTRCKTPTAHTCGGRPQAIARSTKETKDDNPVHRSRETDRLHAPSRRRFSCTTRPRSLSARRSRHYRTRPQTVLSPD